MNNDNLIINGINKIIFKSKPEAVPYHSRLSYKISFICMILKITSSKSGCSIAKIQLIANYYYNQEQREFFLQMLKKDPYQIIFRYTPTVNKAILYLLAEGLIKQQKNGTYRLLNKGKHFTNEILNNNIFINEISYLKQVGDSLPESLVNEMRNNIQLGVNNIC
ncbi:hypothetical protein [Bacillus sp. NPDC094106]|uniref:hypothetical protein n=1 Tax=Bacillus sp. NPDC094106 TaxID=3363949 RepID=UPI0037FFC542